MAPSSSSLSSLATATKSTMAEHVTHTFDVCGSGIKTWSNPVALSTASPPMVNETQQNETHWGSRQERNNDPRSMWMTISIWAKTSKIHRSAVACWRRRYFFSLCSMVGWFSCHASTGLFSGYDSFSSPPNRSRTWQNKTEKVGNFKCLGTGANNLFATSSCLDVVPSKGSFASEMIRFIFTTWRHHDRPILAPQRLPFFISTSFFYFGTQSTRTRTTETHTTPPQQQQQQQQCWPVSNCGCHRLLMSMRMGCHYTR